MADDKKTLCQWHGEDIMDLKHAVFGNGQEGLKTGMTKIREQVRLLLWINGIVAVTTITYVLGSILKGVFGK